MKPMPEANRAAPTAPDDSVDSSAVFFVVESEAFHFHTKIGL